MNNFNFYNPTKIIFGENTILKLKEEMPKEAKILFIYGGGSIKQNGIYNQVISALKGFDYLEFSGITANPEYETLVKAIEIVKANKINFLLAVGGGSVIDGTKFIAAAAISQTNDYWSLVTNGKSAEMALPFASILTLPATGSEMNSGAVITYKAKGEKLAFRGDALFPKFSILDPTVIKSLPENQIANGIVDSFVHVTEQYLTFPVGATLIDRFSESILKTLIDIAPKIMKNKYDYNVASNFMFCSTMALNGLIKSGVPTDWVTHLIGHELTALYGIDHARTLAIILPNYLKYNIINKKEKLLQYANNVWNINDTDNDTKALMVIEKTKDFFNSLNINTKLSQYTDDYSRTANIIKTNFANRQWLKLGERANLTPDDIYKIVEMSY